VTQTQYGSYAYPWAVHRYPWWAWLPLAGFLLLNGITNDACWAYALTGMVLGMAVYRYTRRNHNAYLPGPGRWLIAALVYLLLTLIAGLLTALPQLLMALTGLAACFTQWWRGD
jgi:hypothetical protein